MASSGLTSTEALVVGAGPAGSAVALLLARRGHDVLLVDQSRFPRDKPCGEYLNPSAVAVLSRLGVDAMLAETGARIVKGAHLTSPGGRTVRVLYPGPEGSTRPLGLSVPRLALDAALLDAARTAGVRVREGFRVDGLLRSGPRVVGVVGRCEGREVKITSRLVLAADGSRSTLARRLGLAREPAAPRRFGLVAHYEGVEGDDWVEMHAGEHGYCGLGFSANGGANVAMVAEPGDLPRLGGRVEAFYEERLAQFPAVARRVAAGRRISRILVTGSMSSLVAEVGAPGVLLVGDSAGFYDPFTGEGLSYALRGAELAADAADTVLNHRDTENTENTQRKRKKEGAGAMLPMSYRSISLRSLCLCGSDRYNPAEAAAFRTYARRRQEEFGPRVLLSRIIQAVLRRPWVLEAAFRRFEAEPGLAQRLVGVTAGVLPPRAVLSPGYLLELSGLLAEGRVSGRPRENRVAGER